MLRSYVQQHPHLKLKWTLSGIQLSCVLLNTPIIFHGNQALTRDLLSTVKRGLRLTKQDQKGAASGAQCGSQ